MYFCLSVFLSVGLPKCMNTFITQSNVGQHLCDLISYLHFHKTLIVLVLMWSNIYKYVVYFSKFWLKAGDEIYDIYTSTFHDAGKCNRIGGTELWF